MISGTVTEQLKESGVKVLSNTQVWVFMCIAFIIQLTCMLLGTVLTLCGLVLRSTYMTLNESIFETVQSGCIKTVIDSVPSVW